MQTMLEEIFQTSLQVRDTRNRPTAGLYIDQASFIGHVTCVLSFDEMNCKQ